MLKNKSKMLKEIIKNRFLLVSGLLLITGVLMGSYAVRLFPAVLKERLFSIATFETENLLYSFADNFVFPFILFAALFLSGFSAAGHLTACAEMLLCGAFVGIKSAVLLLDSNEIYIKFFILYGIFICFMAVILSESAFFMSSAIIEKLKSNTAANTHYQAKILTVKYITFTVVSAAISLLFRMN